MRLTRAPQRKIRIGLLVSMADATADKLEELVEEIISNSRPSQEWHTPDSDPDGEKWARRVRALCGQIFFQGMSAGWDKHVAVVEQAAKERQALREAAGG